MKKFFSSLPMRLLLGVIIGILVGQIANLAVMNVVVTVSYVMGQLITFCVPLIIIGFIAPSITKLGNNASRMLAIAVTLAYVSSVCAALFSMAAGYTIIPGLSIQSEVEGLRELPDVVFELSIPQIMSVMSALVFSVLIGVAATWTKAKMITGILDEFQRIVLEIVSKIIIPILPFYIAFTFTGLSYVETMSSAATLAVALKCAHKSKPTLRGDMIDFGIPLFANIHLCGSVLTEVFFVMVVSQILHGSIPSMSTMILFCVLLGVFGFDEAGTALMLTVFALQDSFGTAYFSGTVKHHKNNCHLTYIK